MQSNIHLRGIDKLLLSRLKQEAAEQDVSVNSLVLQLLKQALGLATQRHVSVYHDLDKLAGTWSKQEAKTFTKSVADFEKIDKDIW